MFGSSDRILLPDEVIRVLSAAAGIQRIELTGSRASGRATPLSDWDFRVVTANLPTSAMPCPGSSSR